MIYADEMALAFRVEHPAAQIAHYSPRVPWRYVRFVVPGKCLVDGTVTPPVFYCPELPPINGVRTP